MEKRTRPLVVFINGLTAHSQDYRFIPIVENIFKGEEGMPGMDIVNINHRGLAGAKLTTARMYSCAAISDVIEPLLSIYERFGKNSDQKCYVIGFSMGASMLTNALGEIDKEHGGPLYDGACIIQAPMKIWMSYKAM